MARAFALAIVLLLTSVGCAPTGSSPRVPPVPPPPTESSRSTGGSKSPSGGPPSPTHHVEPTPVSAPFRNPLPGMPPVKYNDVYAATRAGMLSPSVRHVPAYLYVPDAGGARVTVISQRTHKIVRVLHTGQLSQHVTPSYDLRVLYTEASAANKLVVIDPRTARVRKRISLPRPYNLYFTPDGRQGVVMVEQHNKILFTDPDSFRRRRGRTVRGCRGPNHADFAGNGRSMIVTCEFSAAVLKLSTQTHKVLGVLRFGKRSMPQDIRLSPDGKVCYVADMGSNRVRVISVRNLKQIGTIRTPAMPHGLYPSRNGKFLYVSDRGAGEVSVIRFATNKIVDNWKIRGGGSPDMGGVSANGKVLWLTGRYDGVVYGFNTTTGGLIARIKVGGNPHGMLVWPQPGRYSLGHTGNMR